MSALPYCLIYSTYERSLLFSYFVPNRKLYCTVRVILHITRPSTLRLHHKLSQAHYGCHRYITGMCSHFIWKLCGIIKSRHVHYAETESLAKIAILSFSKMQYLSILTAILFDVLFLIYSLPKFIPWYSLQKYWYLYCWAINLFCMVQSSFTLYSGSTIMNKCLFDFTNLFASLLQLQANRWCQK